MSEPALKAWTLPFVVAGIAVSIVLGFYLGGPGLGMAVGGLAAATIVVMAIRHPPTPAIVPPAPLDSRRHVLIVLGRALDDSAAAAVARLVDGADAGPAAEALLISPCRSRFLDRWACDLETGRHRAQQALVLSAATLAKAGVRATARVGDEDLVQMTEDVLRTFPATEVVLVDSGDGGDAPADQAAEQLESRLRTPFRRIQAGPTPDWTSLRAYRPSSAVRRRRPMSSEGCVRRPP